MQDMDNQPETGLQINDRAQRVVEGMRRAAEERNDSQRKAVEFIREQAERLASVESELAATRVERDSLRADLQSAAAAAETARRDRAAEAAARDAAHGEELERVVGQASDEIGRIREWVAGYKVEMQSKQEQLERDNGRLALESERLSEENALLAQAAESLIEAAGESAAALQRQEAALAEALRQAPVQRGEGNLVHLRPRPEPVQGQAWESAGETAGGTAQRQAGGAAA